MGQDIALSCFKNKSVPPQVKLNLGDYQPTSINKKDSLFSSKEFKTKPLPDLALKHNSLSTKVSRQNDEHTAYDDKESIHLDVPTTEETQGRSDRCSPSCRNSVPQHEISFESFKITHEIGCGTWGQVYLGQWVNPNGKKAKRLAIKQMKKNKIFEKNLVGQVLMEKRVMQTIKSNFITSLECTFQDDLYCYIVMEEAQGGDVFSLTDPALPSREATFREMGEVPIRFILACVILGLEALHQKNVCYNDLKPENLLVFQDGYVRLSDFGLSRHLQPRQKSYSVVGTPAYFSPEMALRDGCNITSDLWSLGILAYELANNECPFDVKDIEIPNKFAGLVLNAEIKRKWHKPEISTELKSLINSLLKFDPKVRLGAKSFNDLKNHEFFKSANFNWEQLQSKKMQSPLLSIIKEDKIIYQPVKKEDIRPLFSMFDTKDDYKIEGWTLEALAFE